MTWTSFVTEETAGNNNSSTGNSTYVGVGTHLLRIEGLERGSTASGIPFVDISYTNEDKQTLRDRLYPLYQGEQSKKYKNLAFGLLKSDPTLRYKFFSPKGILPANATLFDGLVGAVVKAEVGLANSGYSIERDGEELKLYDVKEKAFYTLGGGIPNSFKSYPEAREAAKAQGLYRAWNEIKKFDEAPEFFEHNQALIKALAGDVQGSI